MASKNHQTVAFQPEDYSRFLIREFLKKSGFDQTYEMFIKEDKRPKVSMTKNELTKLLGLDAIMKKNSKTKQFSTMLDIVSNYLQQTKLALGGVTLPPESQPVVSQAPRQSFNTLQEKSVPQAAKTATSGFFKAPQESQKRSTLASENAPKPIKNAFVKKPTVVDEDYEWDAEESPVKSSSTASKTTGISNQNMTRPKQNNNFFGASSEELKSRQQAAPSLQKIQKKVVNQPRAAPKFSAPDNDLDDLDDILGGIPKKAGREPAEDDAADLFGGPSKPKKAQQEGMMRDTLGFLKAAEQEKKDKARKRAFEEEEAKTAYKKVTELNYNLEGYSTSYTYNFATNQGGVAQRQRGLITKQMDATMRQLLFKSPSATFHDSWNQGFFFDQKMKYGIFQDKGGPCGILATVNAFILKHALFIHKKKLTEISPQDQKSFVAAAITDILMNATDGQRSPILVLPSQSTTRLLVPSQCSQITLNSRQDLYKAVCENINMFCGRTGPGVVCLVFSVMLTVGLEQIMKDVDMEGTALVNEYGYASQELINSMLVGKACSNVHDGDKDMGDNFILKGIHKQSEIGFLTLFEHYEYFQVGRYLKQPQVPIWIVCSESHYSVLFSTDMQALQPARKDFDLVYYDELARQEDDIILTLQPGQWVADPNKKKNDIVPIDSVIRTKWQTAKVNWNGRTIIL